MTQTFRHLALLNGGLGNQLFQISALFAGGKGHQLGVEVSLGFDKHATYMGESLSGILFPSELIQVRQKRLLLIKKLLSNYLLAHGPAPTKRSRRILKFVTKQALSSLLYFEDKTKYIIITEADITKYLSTPNENYFLIGYFQTSRWFKESFAREQFKEIEFRVSPEVASFASRILKQGVKGLHFRIGDYVMEKDPYGVLPNDYYAAALLELKLKTGGAVLFSDTPNEASLRLHIDLNLVHELPPITRNAAETLYLMSHCKSLIIANSSLSWFAAQIGALKGVTKEVVAPSPWFRLLSVENDLLEDNWRTVNPWHSECPNQG